MEIREAQYVAVQAARRAGQELMRLWHQPIHVRHKGRRDLITNADMAAEQVIVDTILSHYPHHVILTEERGPVNGTLGLSEFQWIVDPLDGTTNYARRLPFFSVSVAVAQEGRPIIGAVYDPLRERMYCAIRGGGAFCNEERLACSQARRFIDMVIGFDWPRDDAQRMRLLGVLSPASSQVGGWRSFGSACLGLCHVAEGSADAYLHPTLCVWDVAAAGLIVEEAGGRITKLDGSDDWWHGGTCLASNGLMHEDLVCLLHGSPLGHGPS